MGKILHREFVYLWYYFTLQFSQIAGYWAAGILIGSFISLFAKDSLHRMLGKMDETRIGLAGIIPACLLGIASPLCMYGTVPLAASFQRQGIREDWLAAFMMSSILLNPQLIIYSAALGVKMLWIRIISCFLCGVCAGLLVHIFYHGKNFFDFGSMQERESHDTDPNPVMRYFKNVWRNIRATGPYFLAGILLSALFQRYVPRQTVTAVFGGNEAWGVLMAATIGVPLYACGGGTIPLLREWLWQGMSSGSACAFMLTGPATKITNLGALKICMGIRRFLLYLAYVMGFSFLCGCLVNVFF